VPSATALRLRVRRSPPPRRACSPRRTATPAEEARAEFDRESVPDEEPFNARSDNRDDDTADHDRDANEDT